MPDERTTIETPLKQLDERGIARKYGLRELVYPDSEQLKALIVFLDHAMQERRCGPVPKTAVVVMLEMLQGTLNRQHLTKGPRMSQEEFDILQTPYYLSARVINKVLRERQEKVERGKMYQQTYITLNHFIELMRSLLDPGCYWIRKAIPDGVLEVMEVLRDFAMQYPEQRRKGRAT